jgi:hypothetical protein
MATSRDQILAVFQECFPVSEALFSYEFVGYDQGRATVRLVVWDEVDGNRSIRDIKEQELFLFDPALPEGDTPILEFVRGWSEALREVFANASLKDVEWLMPHDLGPGDAVMLRRATTAADYRAAMLKKSRLGKFLT